MLGVINIGVFSREHQCPLTCLFCINLFCPFFSFFAPFCHVSLLYFDKCCKKAIACHPQSMPGCASSSSSSSLLPWRFLTCTSSIWRWKGWNHPDSRLATELLKLPDKAVRPHFGSNCQSKLALPFTINTRLCRIRPMSKPCKRLPRSEALKASLPSQYVCLLRFLAHSSVLLSALCILPYLLHWRHNWVK